MNEPATDVPPWATMSTLAEASDTGLLDIRRLGDMLARIKGQIPPVSGSITFRRWRY